jgi:hypothetical protein
MAIGAGVLDNGGKLAPAKPGGKLKEVIMPFPNEHAARVVVPGKFTSGSFRRKSIATGVSIIIGKLIGKTAMTTQAYRFNKDEFTVVEAKQWLKDNDVKFILFEPASEPPKPKTGTVKKEYTVDIVKADEAARLVTGIVLEPETFDSQDQIYSPAVIAKAAHDFLAMYNRVTKTGVQHTDYNKEIEVVESYIAPVKMTLGGKKVKKGSWVMTVHVTNDDVWEQVEKKELTGFSIKGLALAKPIDTK